MSRLVWMFAAAIATVAMAQVPPTNVGPQQTRKIGKMGRAPGYEPLLAPLSGKAIRIVDGQKVVSRDVVRVAAAGISSQTGYPLEVLDGDAIGAGFEDGNAGLVVLLDGRIDAPSLLVAPEDGWAAIGVVALKAGNPSAEVLETRVRKELWRAIAYALGVGNEPIPSVLRPVTKPSDLEGPDMEPLPTPAAIGAMGESANRRGIGRIRYVSYRQACREGWAPPPTNEAQRVFYEQAKADKERGPTNPITIQPPKKEQRK